MRAIEVSVIVTTRNEEAHIAACLDSVKKQDYPANKLELIVVDNNSSDETKAIASRFTDLIFNVGPERSAQRNFGIAESRGKYVLYLDADMILSKQLITECVGECERKGLIALYIPEKIIGKGYWIKVRDFERSFYNATCIDAVRFVRKETILQAGGFDENLNGPEDWDFDRRIREYGRVDVIKNPLYHNEGRFQLKRYLRKKRYYSKDFDSYINKWGRYDKIIQKQFGLGYRCVVVFMGKGKKARFLRHPLLATGMCFLRFLVGINYLLLRKNI